MSPLLLTRSLVDDEVHKFSDALLRRTPFDPFVEVLFNGIFINSKFRYKFVGEFSENLEFSTSPDNFKISVLSLDADDKIVDDADVFGGRFSTIY